MKKPRFDPAEPTGQKGSLSLPLSLSPSLSLSLSLSLSHTQESKRYGGRGEYCAQQLHERGQAMKLRSQSTPCEVVDFLTDIWFKSINV